MKKLDKRWKMFVYALAGLGINMLSLMMNSYLCSALLVGGFGEAAIPFQTFVGKDLVIPAVWAVFAMLAKILDGVIDIPMASFTDRLRSRWGRRRPALIIGFVPMILAYLLFLVIPNPQGATLLNTVYFGVILCIFYTSYTLTMVTYYATFTEIVDNVDERNFISNVKSVCDIVYFILGYVVVRALLNGTNIRVVALLVLPLAFTMLIPLFMIKENSTLKGDLEVDESVSLIKSFACTFKNSLFIRWMIVYIFMNFGVQLFLGGINEYFSFVGLNMMIVMSSSFAAVPLTLILYNKLIKDRGFGFAYRYVLITFGIGMTVMFISGISAPGVLKTVLSIVGGVICSFAMGAMFSVAYSIPSELAAREEKKTGVSNSAMYFAVQGLFTGVSSGIGSGLVLTALKGSENSNSQGVKYLTLIAAGAMVISLIMTFTLPKEMISLGQQKKAEE